jgi:3-hydroxy-9,10-secoandrosta-1,3,5(10)-triene-9,17-dione monooxygenase reductase component
MSAGLDASRLRSLMSHWATGVSVIMSRDEHGPRGSTVNAVNALSLDPPRLLVCFDTSSRTLAAVRASGRFAVNVLRAEDESMSRRFAGKSDDKFPGLALRDVCGAPVLAEVLAWIVCGVREELSRGDHVVILGEPLSGDAQPEADPLIFFRSAYRRLETPPPARSNRPDAASPRTQPVARGTKAYR